MVALLIVLIGGAVIFIIFAIYYFIKMYLADKEIQKKNEIARIDALEMEKIAKEEGITVLNLHYEVGHYKTVTSISSITSNIGYENNPYYITTVSSFDYPNWVPGLGLDLLASIKISLFLTEPNISLIEVWFGAKLCRSNDTGCFSERKAMIHPKNSTFGRGYVKGLIKEMDFDAARDYDVIVTAITLHYNDSTQPKHFDRSQCAKMGYKYNFATGEYKYYLPSYVEKGNDKAGQ